MGSIEKKMTRDQRRDYLKSRKELSRKERAELKEYLLNDHNPYFPSNIFRWMKSAVTNEDGVLNTTSLKRNHVYLVIDPYEIHEISELIRGRKLINPEEVIS